MQAPGENGTAWCFNDLGTFRYVDLLAPFNSPNSFLITADLMPRPILGHSAAIGLTNSNVLEDNLESSATVWVRILAQATGVQGSGLAEFRTRGLAGPSVTAQIPVDFNGFKPGPDHRRPDRPSCHRHGQRRPPGHTSDPAGTTKYLGVEGSGGIDNLLVRLP